PGDPGATRALQDATQKLQAKTPPPPPPPPPPRAQFDKHMQNAAALEKQQKFAEAANAYQEALKLMPQDAQAKAGLRNTPVNNHLTEGQRAWAQRRFPDAVRAFEAALQIMPGTPAAAAGLKQAKQGK